MAEEQEAQRAALRRVAGVLKRTGLPFALAGSYGLWAHGAPESAHDVDFVIAEEHVEQIAAALADAGLDVIRPPEDWLLKVPTDGVTVDLLHRLARQSATVEMLAHSHVFEVLSVEMPVLDATDLLSSKLGALTEHFCDFAPLLAATRAVREQVDWTRVRAEVAGHDFALAFLFLTDRLGLTDSALIATDGITEIVQL
jgi:hypothetical protein